MLREGAAGPVLAIRLQVSSGTVGTCGYYYILGTPQGAPASPSSRHHRQAQVFWVSREGSALWLMRGISPHNVTDMGISAMIKPVEGAGALVSGIA